MKRILIVEDDTLLNKTLAYNLTSDGWDVPPALNAKTAASLLAQENLNRLHGLLLREEQAGSDAAGALCWAISTLARLLDVSKLDTLGEEGDEA